jgi:hypothetical protein
MEKSLLPGRDQIPDSLKTLVYRHLRKRRWDERQLAEQRTTKHHLEARKSCVADSRNYRVAREFPISIAAQLDWKTIITSRRSNLFGAVGSRNFETINSSTGRPRNRPARDLFYPRVRTGSAACYFSRVRRS